MARANIINRLYSYVSPDEFDFNKLSAPPLYSLLTQYDVHLLHDIAIDPRLTSKIEKKYEYIKQILAPRGFVRFAGGTNRVVYRFRDDQSFVLKVGIDQYGITDSPAEMKNQWALQPFVTRMFECSPCGTVGIAERVEPINSVAQFMSLAPDIFEMLTKKIIGKYVLEDIGSLYFKNYGIRMVNPVTGSRYAFGPVLLDYPYMYELDGEKLFCNDIDFRTGKICGGQIDYDDGFNRLVCEKCGREIHAYDLRKKIENKNIIVTGRKETGDMKVAVYRGDVRIKGTDTTKTVKTYSEASRLRKKSTLKVSTNGYKQSLPPRTKEEKEEKNNLYRQQTRELIAQIQGISEEADSIKEEGSCKLNQVKASNEAMVRAPYPRKEESAEQSASYQESNDDPEINNEEESEDCDDYEIPVPSNYDSSYEDCNNEDDEADEYEEEEDEVKEEAAANPNITSAPIVKEPEKRFYDEEYVEDGKRGYPAKKRRTRKYDDMEEY